MLKPEYGNIIIVATIYKNIFNWYITEKELWLMDLSNEEFICEERYGILILNENTVEQFFYKIKDCRINTQELKKMFINSLKYDFDLENTLYDFRPSIYINFDKKQLYSSFPEMTSFQEYVPSGWLGKYVNLQKLLKLIGDENNYWIVGNKNYYKNIKY